MTCPGSLPGNAVGGSQMCDLLIVSVYCPDHYATLPRVLYALSAIALLPVYVDDDFYTVH